MYVVIEIEGEYWIDREKQTGYLEIAITEGLSSVSKKQKTNCHLNRHAEAIEPFEVDLKFKHFFDFDKDFEGVSITSSRHKNS